MAGAGSSVCVPVTLKGAASAYCVTSREPDDPGYVAVKIYVTGKISKTATNEIAVYDRIKAAAPEADHAAHDYIRRLLSSFDIKGPRGTHKCLVHEVMGTSLDVLLDWFPGKTLELEALKAPLRQIIVGLNFLETQAGIIHTGEFFVIASQ